MNGVRFDEGRDHPLFVIRTDFDQVMITQTNEFDECESILTGAARLRAIVDYLDAMKNIDQAEALGA